MKPAPAIATVSDDYDPFLSPMIGHNQPPEVEEEEEATPPPEEAIFATINDLFDEAKNFADGEPIDSESMHDVMTDLRERLHKAGAEAEALRKEAVKPHDDAKAAIQAKYNPYVKDKTGKVAMGKSAIDVLTGAWRVAKQQAAAAEAARIAKAAADARLAAQAAIQASSGNLAAREEAEAALADAKRLEKSASRATKAATTGTGLVTRWVAEMVDVEAAMEWTWARAQDELLAVAQANADVAVRGGVRQVPGFRVVETKGAR